MDISKLTKEELETLQSQITTQLSAVEREEIKQQTPEEQLEQEPTWKKPSQNYTI